MSFPVPFVISTSRQASSSFLALSFLLCVSIISDAFFVNAVTNTPVVTLPTPREFSCAPSGCYLNTLGSMLIMGDAMHDIPMSMSFLCTAPALPVLSSITADESQIHIIYDSTNSSVYYVEEDTNDDNITTTITCVNVIMHYHADVYAPRGDLEVQMYFETNDNTTTPPSNVMTSHWSFLTPGSSLEITTQTGSTSDRSGDSDVIGFYATVEDSLRHARIVSRHGFAVTLAALNAMPYVHPTLGCQSTTITNITLFLSLPTGSSFKDAEESTFSYPVFPQGNEASFTPSTFSFNFTGSQWSADAAYTYSFLIADERFVYHPQYITFLSPVPHQQGIGCGNVSCYLSTLGGMFGSYGNTLVNSEVVFYCPKTDTMRFEGVDAPYEFGVVSTPTKTVRPLQAPDDPHCNAEVFSFPVQIFNVWPGTGPQEFSVNYRFTTTTQPRYSFDPHWDFYVTFNHSTPDPSQLSVMGGDDNVALQSSLQIGVLLPSLVSTDTFQIISTASSPRTLSAARVDIVRTILTNVTTGNVISVVEHTQPPPGEGCTISALTPTPATSALVFLFPKETCRDEWPWDVLYTYQINVTDGVYSYPPEFLTLTTNVALQPSGDLPTTSANVGLIVGATIGGIVGLVLVIWLVRCYRRRNEEGNMFTKLLGEDSASVSFV